MSKSKLTLIIDGNWLLMSRKSVMDNRYASDEELIKHLKLLMIKSINVVLRTFPNIDNIMFVSDGGSWRNNVEIPAFLKKDGIEYKGNREPNPNTNWDVIFGGYHEFLETLKECGINVYREKGIEGDDWAWYLSSKLNDEGTNCIIWTKDHDLMQLVKTNSDGCFTVWYEKDNGIYTETKDDDDLNFLFNTEYNKNEEIFKEICKNAKSVNKVIPNTIVVDKIIRGDGGDNILPIVMRKAKTASEKKFRVSYKDMDMDMDVYDDNAVRTWISNLTSSKSYIDRILDDKTDEEIFEHFKYNRKLVSLTGKNYPDDVYSTMANYVDYECNKDISIAEQKLQAELMGDVDIFESI